MAKTKAKNTNTNSSPEKSSISSKTYAKWTPEYRKQHTAEYNKAHYDTLLCRIPKSAKSQIRDAAERRGMSMTAFVMECVFREIADESIRNSARFHLVHKSP